MAGNLLQAIGLPPEWFQSVMGGVANGMDAPEPEAPAAAPQPAGLSPSWFANVMGNGGDQAPPQPAAAPSPNGLTPEWFSGVMGNDMPGGKPANLLEELTPQAQAQFQQGAAAPQAAPQAAPTAAPKSRRSLLDTVGRIADVFAKVGGADALYQPTLDGREDRAMAIEDRARGIDLDKLKLTLAGQQVEGGRNDLANAETAKLGLGIRGLQAIQARGGDPAKAWPIIAQQMGIDPGRAAEVGEALAADPNALFGLNAALNGPKNGDGEFGLQPFYAKDANGNVQAFQLGKDGSIHPVALPEGFSPAGTTSVVDNGDANVVIDKRTGQPVRVMPKAGGPSTGQRPIVDARGRVVGYQDLPGARVPQTTGGAAGAKAQQDFEQRTAGAGVALENLGELRSTYGKLDEMGAMVNPNNSAAGNIGARLRASGPGQLVEGAVGTQAQTLRDRVASLRPGLMQSIAKATGMTGKQLDSNADVKLWMQTVTDPTSSYQANMAAIDGLERFVRANTPKAPPAAPRRALPPRAGQPAAPKPKPAAPRRQSAPPGLGPRVGRPGKPTVSNW